jgi:hypothetical protein
MLYFIIKVCAYIRTVTRMAGVARDNYRRRNERHEERPDNPIPDNFLDLTGRPLERFMIKWYDNWRSGEEFDGAGKGKDNYHPVSLQAMFRSFKMQWKEQRGSGEAPIIGPDFGKLLKDHDNEYLWEIPPSGFEKDRDPFKLIFHDKYGSNERVHAEVTNSILKLIT